MNITVIGSYRQEITPWPLRNKDQFPVFCEQLGKRLAESDHFLTVPCDNDEDSADWFCLRGFRSVKKNPSSWAVKAPLGRKGNISEKGHIDAAREADCVIMVGGANGTYAAGMTAIYRRILVLPVGCFGGAAEDILSALRLPHNHILKTAICNASSIDTSEIVDVLIKELNGHPRLFLVHGRSKDRDSVKSILQADFPNLHSPIILDYSGNAAIGLASKFSSFAGTSTGAIVIATPDDIGASVLDGNGMTLNPSELMKFAPRARENVWLEMGWLWAGLGRNRILLLVKGDTGIPSDIRDAVYVPYHDDPSEAKSKIIQFVKGLRQSEELIKP